MTRSIPDNGDDVSVHLEVEGVRDADVGKQSAPAEAEQQ
jgi:hypothetical protein